MNFAFENCYISLTGLITINADPINYSWCLTNCATASGCNLVLKGESEELEAILATANGNPNITIGN